MHVGLPKLQYGSRYFKGSSMKNNRRNEEAFVHDETASLNKFRRKISFRPKARPKFDRMNLYCSFRIIVYIMLYTSLSIYLVSICRYREKETVNLGHIESLKAFCAMEMTSISEMRLEHNNIYIYIHTHRLVCLSTDGLPRRYLFTCMQYLSAIQAEASDFRHQMAVYKSDHYVHDLDLKFRKFVPKMTSV